MAGLFVFKQNPFESLAEVFCAPKQSSGGKMIQIHFASADEKSVLLYNVIPSWRMDLMPKKEWSVKLTTGA